MGGGPLPRDGDHFRRQVRGDEAGHGGRVAVQVGERFGRGAVAGKVDAHDARWATYLYQRPNPKGPTRERWRHARGCGCWFNLVRDTSTHEVLAVYRMGEAPPETGR